MTTQRFLEEAALKPEWVDRFLDLAAHNRAMFDAELGYRPRNHVERNGVSRSWTRYTYHPAGERRMIHYADRPCRINTYGDSLTHCDQVSDGETWQEYLAAHFGEPVRNFGVGGYGVYQAYRRMLREEKTTQAAEYLILNVYVDDHFRSLYKWRWLYSTGFRRKAAKGDPPAPGAFAFHNTPWAHVHFNADSGEFEERENQYATPESLYQLCDKEHVVDAFENDFVFQAYAAQQKMEGVKADILQEAADALVMPVDLSSPDAAAVAASKLLRTCALRSSIMIVGKARTFAEANDKKLMLLLSYGHGFVGDACEGRARWDQPFVDHLADNGFLFVDSLEKHVADYQAFSCSAAEYAGRHFIGHYSPAGNHFFAFAIKDAITDWLAPKPPAYGDACPSGPQA